LENNEDIHDAILELTNVLTSSLTTRLAQEMKTEITYSSPNISEISLEQIADTQTFKNYSQVIVIYIQINFKDQKINGEIFILTKDGSIQWLKQRLNSILAALI